MEEGTCRRRILRRVRWWSSFRCNRYRCRRARFWCWIPCSRRWRVRYV